MPRIIFRSSLSHRRKQSRVAGLHSFRSEDATHLENKHVPEPLIMIQGRWKTSRAESSYVNWEIQKMVNSSKTPFKESDDI